MKEAPRGSALFNSSKTQTHTSVTPKATGSQETLPNQMLKLKMNLFKSLKQQARTQPFTNLRKRITLHDERLESLSNLLNVTLVQRKPFINLHVLIVRQRFVSSLSQRSLKCKQWRPTVTHNHPLTHTHTHSQTHTQCNCPVMQRESVSKDKAISRSEYRHKQKALSSMRDTQDNSQHTLNTHTGDICVCVCVWRQELTGRKDRSLNPRMNVQVPQRKTIRHFSPEKRLK